jgi:hypothetical protein
MCGYVKPWRGAAHAFLITLSDIKTDYTIVIRSGFVGCAWEEPKI